MSFTHFQLGSFNKTNRLLLHCRTLQSPLLPLSGMFLKATFTLPSCSTTCCPIFWLPFSMPPSKTSRGGSSPPDEPAPDLAAASCPICLDDLEDAASAIPCGHIYCHECILVWVRQRNRCPLCRAVISRLRHQEMNPRTGRLEEAFDQVRGSFFLADTFF